MTQQEESMDGFVPYSVAAAQTGYSYTTIRQLARDQRVTTRPFYGRTFVSLADVIAYQTAQVALGPAKHTPKKYRAVGENISQEIIPEADADA